MLFAIPWTPKGRIVASAAPADRWHFWEVSHVQQARGVPPKTAISLQFLRWYKLVLGDQLWAAGPSAA